MNCKRATHHIPRFLHGELREPKADRLRLHLLNCSGCTGRLEQERRAFAALGALGDEPIPPENWAGFNTRLKAAIDDLPAGGNRRAGSLRWSRPIRVGLASAAGLAIALFVVTGNSPPPTEPAVDGGSPPPLIEQPLAATPQDNPTADPAEPVEEPYPFQLEEVTSLAEVGDEL